MPKHPPTMDDDPLDKALESLLEAMRARVKTLRDLGAGRATRVMYQNACDRERTTREKWEQLSKGYYDRWQQDARQVGSELTGWVMGRIRRTISLGDAIVSEAWMKG